MIKKKKKVAEELHLCCVWFGCLQGKTQVASVILLQVLCPAPGLGFQHCTYHTGAPEINMSNHIQMALSLGSGTQCEYSEVSNPKLRLYELTPSGLRKTLLYISCLIFSKQKVTTSECNEVCGLYHCQYWRWKCLWSVEWLEQWKNLDKRQINLQV